MSTTYLQRLLIVTFAYWAAGLLGSYLSLPGDAVSPFWPAAGVALAALLLWGPGMWLGVLAGGLLIQFQVAHLAALQQGWEPVLLAFCAVAQGLVGAWLLGFQRQWQLLSGSEIFRLMARGALLSAAVGASLELLVTLLSAAPSSHGTLPALVINWTGNALGIALVAPICLLWANGTALGRLLWTSIPMVLVSAALIWGVQQLVDSRVKQVSIELNRQADVLSEALKARCDHYLQSLTGLMQIFRGSEYVSREEFRVVADELLAELPAINAIGWLPRVEVSQKAAFEASASQELGKAYRIQPPADDSHWLQEASSSVIYPVLYIEPRQGNATVLGFLPGTSEGAAMAMTQAIRSGKVAMGEVGEQNIGLVFRAAMGQDGKVMGLVFAKLDVGLLLAATEEAIRNAPLRLSVQDDSTRQFILGQAEVGGGLHAHRSVQVGGRLWRLDFQYQQPYVLDVVQAGLGLMLIGGLLLVVVIGSTVLLVTGQTSLVGQEVAKRTRELQAVNQQLRENEHFLNSLVDNLPLSLQVKEAKGLRFKRVNKACETLFGQSRQALEGQDDASLWPPEVVASLNRDDRQALAGEERTMVSEERLPTVKGERWFRTLRVPVLEPDNASSHLLILREDITEALNNEARVQELNVALAERNSELSAANHQLEQLSRIDALTQVANRRVFDEELANEWQRCARHQLPLGVMMLDVDHFKRFNDAVGHLKGDVCLQRIAQLLSAAIQRSSDLVARFGGEEFAVILPGSDLAEAQSLAEKVLDTVRQAALAHPDSPLGPHVSVSIGIACGYPVQHDGTERLQLLALADKALYRAKATGRDRCLAMAWPESHS